MVKVNMLLFIIFIFSVYRTAGFYTFSIKNLLLSFLPFMITKDKNLKNRLSNRCDTQYNRHYTTDFLNINFTLESSSFTTEYWVFDEDISVMTLSPFESLLIGNVIVLFSSIIFGSSCFSIGSCCI